jgi:protein TonB
MEILETGQLGRVWVQQSSGYAALDDAALESVQQWRFVPARNADSGQAIRCSTVMSVIFRLNR